MVVARCASAFIREKKKDLAQMSICFGAASMADRSGDGPARQNDDTRPATDSQISSFQQLGGIGG
jgi:hypothetical protein